MNLLKKLTEDNAFTYTEKAIIQFILEDSENFLSLSIYELASQTHSSTSTIVRMCQKCGLTGYKEFKINFARDFELNNIEKIAQINPNTPFIPTDSNLMIAKKIAKLTEETLLATQNLLSDKKLNNIVKLLLSAENIYAFGVSDNYTRLRDFQAKLIRIGIYIKMIDLQAEQFHLATFSTKKDVAILISYSGLTAEIINDANILQKNGTPFILITSHKDSDIAKNASEVLLLPNDETHDLKVSNFSSQLSVEYLLNVIYSCLYNNNFEGNYSKQQKTPTSIFKF